MTWLLRHPRLMVFVVTVLLLLGMGAYIQLLRNRLQNTIHERDELAVVVESKSGELTRFINKNNEQAVRINALLISESNTRRIAESNKFAFLKHIDGLDRRMKNLESATAVSAEIRPPDSTLTRIDTVFKNLPLYRWYVDDGYNFIDITCVDSPMFQCRVPINAVTYWSRKHRFLFLGWGKEYRTEVYSPNKLVYIDSVSSAIKRSKER